MKKLLVCVSLVCLGIFLSSCGQREVVSVLKTKLPSSDWEVMEFIKSVHFDDKLAEFSKCMHKSKKTALEKCEAMIKHFHNSCNLGSGKHCVLQAEFYLRGTLHSTQNMRSKGIEILNTSCESGYASACVSLGEANGNAIKHWQKACELGSVVGCGNLAHIYHKGTQGIKPNIKKAKMYANAELQIANRDCKAGQKVACEWLDKAFSDLKPLLHLKEKH